MNMSYYRDIRLVRSHMKKNSTTHDSLMGTTHSENQDDILIISSENYDLYFLFDGVSQSKNPKKGIELVKKYIKNNHLKYYRNKDLSISSLMIDANQYVLNFNLEEPFTTYAAIFISLDGQQIKYSNIGDTRIYGVSEQYLFQYSHDDVDLNQRNIITKCLGMPELRNEDFTENIINSNEKRLLICTDGFYNLLETKKTRFHNILNFKKLFNIKKSLSDEMLNKNEDDATYILINKKT